MTLIEAHDINNHGQIVALLRCDHPDTNRIAVIPVVLTPYAVRCPADLNGDGVVDGADLGLLMVTWGVEDDPVGDIDGDGVITGSDLGLLIAAWGPCH